ncbi:MAG: hypothetical protein DRZ76_04075 [Candidatus Nealsonbacteria bacterium]|nr:MAG: hypothetical protein DRZ76_04075 [Candidatus Nealsonbacteria bacterium]
MGGVDVELLTYIKKILGKFERVEGIKTYPTYADHFFRSYTVTENVKPIALPSRAYLVRVEAQNAPIMINFDREVTEEEHIVIYPDTFKYVPRVTSVIYARVLQGYGSGILNVEGYTVA